MGENSFWAGQLRALDAFILSKVWDSVLDSLGKLQAKLAGKLRAWSQMERLLCKLQGGVDRVADVPNSVAAQLEAQTEVTPSFAHPILCQKAHPPRPLQLCV